ncbi:MAG TPA: hypothetical protein VGF59_25870, partial [Bryobacteraceae bacterium]
FDAPFAVQSGSVAGTLSFTLEALQAGTAVLTVPDGAARSVPLDAGAPLVRAVTVVRTAGGFQVQILGVSTTRELTRAVVRFHASAGSTVQTPDATIPLDQVSRAWFQAPDSAAYGGQFTLTLPFTFQGGSVTLDSVSVVLSSGAGDSAESTAPY